MTDTRIATISRLEERILKGITPFMFEAHHGQFEAVKIQLAELCNIATGLIDELALTKDITGFDELDQAFLDGLKPHLAMKKKVAS